mmetsp:Transcript_9605/g.17679  ORF Transcript_9605/g.17679 Transcript_9605/m.17679 type:complete len:81 (+) Transcript_9605:2441-2683(+)
MTTVLNQRILIVGRDSMQIKGEMLVMHKQTQEVLVRATIAPPPRIGTSRMPVNSKTLTNTRRNLKDPEELRSTGAGAAKP